MILILLKRKMLAHS